jgi:hypothetical protein
MKPIRFFLIPFSTLLLISCNKEKEQPKVSYDKSKPKTEAPKPDSTMVEIADLPVQIEGTDYLIHPIGDVRFYDTRVSSRAGYDDVSYTISNYNEFEITGFLRNLKFQKTDSDSLMVLSDKPVLIQSVTYLKAHADRTKQALLVYALADMDTNKDGNLDANDIKSLYISEIDGGKFTKLSADMEELINWRVIESKGRLYFRTIEDTNKNGQFDKDDVVHYNHVSLAGEWKPAAYDPVGTAMAPAAE